MVMGPINGSEASFSSQSLQSSVRFNTRPKTDRRPVPMAELCIHRGLTHAEGRSGLRRYCSLGLSRTPHQILGPVELRSNIFDGGKAIIFDEKR